MINGIITDNNVPEGYVCFDTIPTIGIFYCSDVRNGTGVKTYVKDLPEFETVYKHFINCKIVPFFRNKQLDICVSLFYMPYFDVFYERIKQEHDRISLSKKKYLVKYMLMYLADDMQYESIVCRNLIDKNLRDYYIEKDIYVKSKELLKLIK